MANQQSKVQGVAGRFRALMHRRSLSGFTLIELMVVVAILGILLAIAVPSYRQHVAKSRRADAKATLLDLAARQERYYSTNNSYTNNATFLGYTSFPLRIPNTSTINYNISVVTATATTYTAQAVPAGSQASDSCGTFTINHLGVQGVTGGSLTAAQCW